MFWNGGGSWWGVEIVVLVVWTTGLDMAEGRSGLRSSRRVSAELAQAYLTLCQCPALKIVSLCGEVACLPQLNLYQDGCLLGDIR